MLKVLDYLNEEIDYVTGIIDSLCRECPEALLITRIPGIGYYIALLIMAEIGYVLRFRNAKRLFSYAGIVPWEKSS